MTIPILFSLLSILLTLHPSSADTLPQDIFILAGQSNMAGRGGIAGGKWDRYLLPQCRPNPSILLLSTQLTWSEVADPLHADIDMNRVCGGWPLEVFRKRDQIQRTRARSGVARALRHGHDRD
ncbi:hypothetical protein NL676_024887 [Syzygium grande]|nr:hypothetical protein NL676_024887 [Syzygium grande]